MTIESIQDNKDNQSTGIPGLMDIVIVGGGFAGCHAAIALGRAGHKVTLIDINSEIPPLFRAEKISGDQLSLLQELDLLDDFKEIATPVRKFINIRGKHIINRPAVEEYGMLYPAMIDLLRSRLPSNVIFRIGRVADITTSGDIQHVVLASGETIDARLVVLATGYGEALRRKLGFERRQIHPLHTVCVGFSLRPPSSGFRFPALAAYGERRGDGVDYLSLFPLDDMMRANLFMFTDIRDPRVLALRGEGLPALFNILPGLRSWIGDCEMAGDIAIFPVELYKYDNVVRDGVVLIGDAYRTSCPAVGTGLSCAMADIILLRDHITHWFKTPGMSTAKIASFYSDPIKVAHDKKTHKQAFQRRDAIMGTSFASRLRLTARPAMDALRDWLCMVFYRADWERRMNGGAHA